MLKFKIKQKESPNFIGCVFSNYPKDIKNVEGHISYWKILYEKEEGYITSLGANSIQEIKNIGIDPLPFTVIEVIRNIENRAWFLIGHYDNLI
jgi:hypothetical protein